MLIYALLASVLHMERRKVQGGKKNRKFELVLAVCGVCVRLLIIYAV